MHIDLAGVVYLAGHRGMVGSAIQRRLEQIEGIEMLTRTHAELDLTNQAAVDHFFATERPDQVILAAAKVGGIWANNSYPADFICAEPDDRSQRHPCGLPHRRQAPAFAGPFIYPCLAPQPMPEDALLTGPLEPPTRSYAIATKAHEKLAWAPRARLRPAGQ